MDEILSQAIAEARKGLSEGGIPFGLAEPAIVDAAGDFAVDN